MSPREAQELLRHTDPRPTADLYTGPRLLDLSGAVEKPPAPDDPQPAEAATRTGADDSNIEFAPLIALNRGSQRPTSPANVHGAPDQAAGDDAAAHTRLVGFRKNILEVEVDSAARLHELANFRKGLILTRLAEILPACHVREVRFRPGGRA